MRSNPSLSSNKYLIRFVTQIVVTCLAFSLLVGIGFFGWLYAGREWQITIIFQNSDELRGTGGFFGSLAQIRTHGWHWPTLTLFDVYDLDHQIPRYPSAPAGVRRYLSGGRDILHLQDANWERDFPTSSQQIIRLLAQAGQPTPDLLIAVNSTLIEDLLSWVHDHSQVDFYDAHGTPLTPDNFSTLARLDHKLTASPRQPKTKFLSLFADQLTAYWQSMSLWDRIKLIQLLYHAKSSRLWQAYSPHPVLQNSLRFLGASGELQRGSPCAHIYLVPTNVGINKSNHRTDFAVDLSSPLALSSGHTRAQLRLQVRNDNSYNPDVLPTENLTFANYQRFLLPPDTALLQVSIDGALVTDLDWRVITDGRGQLWHEYAFLQLVPAQSTSEIRVTLQGSPRCYAWQW